MIWTVILYKRQNTLMDIKNKRLSEYLHSSTTTRNFITMQLLSFEARIRKFQDYFVVRFLQIKNLECELFCWTLSRPFIKWFDRSHIKIRIIIKEKLKFESITWSATIIQQSNLWLIILRSSFQFQLLLSLGDKKIQNMFKVPHKCINTKS